MRRSFKLSGARAGEVALLASLVFILLGAAAVALALAQLRSAREHVLQRDANVALLQVLQRDVRMAETGQRGYLLVDNPTYLAPYRAAVGRIPANLAALRGAGLAKVEAIPRLEDVVRRKLAELALTIRLHDEAPARALAIVRSDAGQRYMAQIDAEIDGMVRAERDRLRADIAALNRMADRTALMVGITVALALAAGASGIILILRQRRLTELERMNASLEARVEERTLRLTQANEELDAFAYSVSHDLRAPLRAIHGYADVIEEEGGDALHADLRAYLKRISAAAEQMNRLIEDILAYAKLTQETLSVRPVSLDQILENARRGLERDCAVGSLDVASPLGDVLAHPAALQQSIENLLSNACKYVARGAKARITVRAERRGGARRLWVEDNGIGIPLEHYERIFRPFERLHGIESYPGTGIGLAIVRRSVERMGGRCGVERASGGGSAFWIELQEPEKA